jgi:hypothetical protein
MIAGKSKTKYAAALRYTNHVNNEGNKNGESKNELGKVNAVKMKFHSYKITLLTRLIKSCHQTSFI